MLTQQSSKDEYGDNTVTVPVEGEYIVLRLDLGQAGIEPDGSISVQPAFVDSDGFSWALMRLERGQ